MIKGKEKLPFEERLKALGILFPEKRRLKEGLTAVFQYLKVIYKEAGGSLFAGNHTKTWVHVALGERLSCHKKDFIYLLE